MWTVSDETISLSVTPQDAALHLFCSPRYTSTETKASLAVYGSWFALIVDIDNYEGEFYPETRVPTYQEIRAWVKQKYGFNVNSSSISQTKRKYGLITDSEDAERRYTQQVSPEKEVAIREAFIWFGLLEEESYP